MKRTLCLRCGNEYTRLTTHLKNKTKCKPVYFDIDMEEMYSKYEEYYERYLNLNNNTEYNCKFCGKKYRYKSNYNRHKKNCDYNKSITHTHTDIIENTTNINGVFINIGDTNININQNIGQIVVNPPIRNFGNEVYPNEEEFIGMLKYVLIDENGKYIDDNEIYTGFFELLHVDTKENRNLYVRAEKDGHIDVYKEGNWDRIKKYEIKDKLLNITKQQFYDYIDHLIKKHRNNISLHKLLCRARIYFEIYTDDIKPNHNLFAELIRTLHNNKNVLKDIRKQEINSLIIEEESQPEESTQPEPQIDPQIEAPEEPKEIEEPEEEISREELNKRLWAQCFSHITKVI